MRAEAIDAMLVDLCASTMRSAPFPRDGQFRWTALPLERFVERLGGAGAVVISEPAVVCLNGSVDIRYQDSGGWRRFFWWRSRRPHSDARIAAPHQALSAAAPVATSVTEVTAAATNERVGVSGPTETRRAESAAMRGVFLARSRRYAAAEAAFVEAIGLDATLDLLASEAFWTMPRAGQEAAMRAYGGVGRARDAAVVKATLQAVYRPRLIPVARSRNVDGSTNA